MKNRFEKMNEGKVGVGFCPQNAFGSTVGVMPRLVEGVACSRT